MKKQEETEAQRTNVYYPFVCCTNCNLLQTIQINYGFKISDSQCPNCKCKTLMITSSKITNYKND